MQEAVEAAQHADWRATALAAAAALTVAGAAWRYVLGPFFSACWAAILAAPQIRDTLVDLPELVEGLRRLLDAEVVTQISTLRADVAEIRGELTSMRAQLPTIGGGSEEMPPEPFLLSDEDMQRVWNRIRGRIGHDEAQS